MPTLKANAHRLSDTFYQLEVLNSADELIAALPRFENKLNSIGMFPLRATGIDIFQVNIGKMCNQTCRHCHVDAGPDRKEIMSRETMQQCLNVLRESETLTVDITGGAPEMHPDFRWFAEEISKMGHKIMIRCNLTIITANKKYYDLPEFYKKHKAEVICSLPYFMAGRTDAQRGEGVFESSVTALKMLNEAGYGIEGSGLILNLVYNPSGAFLPALQKALEEDFKRQLLSRHGIRFNKLFVITNLPISRFLDYLLESGNYDAYMEKLVNAFNAEAAKHVMCRNTISIGWDGYLYDCDFNQMLDIKVGVQSDHIRNFSKEALNNRVIKVNQHCYGCTAGAGSGCGGELV